MRKFLKYLYTAAAITLLFNYADAQAPVISYSPATNVYTVGTAITALAPTNSGGAVAAATYTNVTTFAGSTAGTNGQTNATGTAARFDNPVNIVTDASGNLFVADLTNNEIRKITPAGVVTTFAGSSTGVAGYTDATGTAARFRAPGGLAMDASGNLFVGDEGNNVVRKITPAGVVTTFAGSTAGTSGTTNATGTAARFNGPAGICFDASGNLFVVDYNNSEIRKITAAGVVTTFAGSSAGTSGYTDATGTLARFKTPTGIAIDGSANLYVTDLGNNSIRKITSAGVVTTLAGSTAGTAGATNATGTAARFSSPVGVALDGAGNVYVGEFGNNDIREITPAGVVTLLAGSTAQVAGTTDGIGTAARFTGATDMNIDVTGTMYLADYSNNSIRKITLSGYAITPALPAGLSFDVTTGIITGTPTAPSAATNYTVTAYNYYGNSSTVVSIACGITVDWKAGSNTTAWATAGNWSSGLVPGVNDAVRIGVVAYTNVKEPSITAASVAVNSVTFGSVHAGTLTVGTGETLTVNNNLTINTGATGTLTGTGTGAVDIAPGAIVNVTGTGKLTITSPLNFTLMSDATGSASIGQVLTTSINGTGASSINVQRYMSGGAGYRGYRLLSSPVYAATVSSNNVYSINYLINSVYLTGSAGGGFDKAGNPSLYLFREDQPSAFSTFTSGNFWGISAINNALTYNYYMNGGATNYNIPAGNGYMFFYRGNRASAVIGTETSTGYIPVSVTLTASGTLNTGQVIVHDWYTPASANLGWTNATANTSVRGFNLVGNPYASSIDWEQYNTTTTTTGIYANNIGTTIYELNPATNNYDTYQVGGTYTNNGSRTIASGQAFFVIAANNTSPQLIFNESAKSTTQNTGLNLFMSNKANLTALNNSNIDQHLRLQMAKDSIHTDDTYIGFKLAGQSPYANNENAPYKTGSGMVSLASISADNSPVAINKMALSQKCQTIALKVNATTDGLYKLNMTELKGIPQIYEVWLMDRYKKDSLNMRYNHSYAFNLYRADTNSYGSTRFQLVIRQNPGFAVHLLDFTAVKGTGSAQIAWKTENEQNYTNFTVERSTDNGATFDVLGGFASSAQGSYSFEDTNPLASNQYRLKLIDLNGTISYSKVITLMYSSFVQTTVKNNINIYPNPASNVINLTIIPNTGATSNSPANQSLSSRFRPNLTVVQPAAVYGIKIINNTGSVIRTATSSDPNWQDNVSSLVPGTYVIQVMNNSNKSLVGKSTFVKL